jgi:small subunit ribosomal protein S21
MATVVKAKDRESADSVIRRFKKKVFESELLTELKRREYYKKPSIERKERKKELERQRRRRRKWS